MLLLNKALATASMLALASTLATTAMAAGTVQVAFIEPAQFADIGPSAFERERTLKDLQSHMQQWAARLPSGRVLKLEVLDVDLAGETWPHARAFAHSEVRVLRGRADWPRATVRWSLAGADGQPLAKGEDRLADMAYLHSSVAHRSGGALPYEKKMFDTWFSDRVIGPAPVSMTTEKR